MFVTVHLPPGLSAAERRRAVRAGPRAVTHRVVHERLLATAGFVDVRHEDWTEAFRHTARAWLEVSQRHAAELVASEGREQFEERQRDRRETLSAVEAGLLLRSCYTARRPETRGRGCAPVCH